jgi:predicted dehydrogenase
MSPSPRTTLIVIGAGDRGTGHADFALRHPRWANVVAVAEPRKVRRERFAAAHGIAEADAVEDWRAIAARGRCADAVLICTQDRDHLEPALAFAEQGYHILLEKPMAIDEASCRAIAEAAERAGVILAVAHVLRYTRYTRALKGLLEAGRIGELVSVQHLEPVGHWHQAHSYVRGNWRRADQATSMLMAKSCHDIDWLQYLVGSPATRVSSFGRLSHFTPANRPAGAADRCTDCPASVREACVFDAVRFYGDALDQGRHHWPLSVVVDEFTRPDLDHALRAGPYGRCVYACDNDAVDHQVVAMEYENGATATFTMTGFTEAADRRTELFGTRGQIRGDGRFLHVHDFLTDVTSTIDTAAIGTAAAGTGTAAVDTAVTGTGGMSAAEGHGGGDTAFMAAFLDAIATGNPSLIPSGPRESLASHLTVFAAEQARSTGSVVEV